MQVGHTAIQMNRSDGDWMLSSWRQVLLIWTFLSSVCVAQSTASTASSPQSSMPLNRASHATTGRPERVDHQKPSSSYHMAPNAACTPILLIRRTAELPRAKSHLIIDSQLSRAGYRLDESNEPQGDQNNPNVEESPGPAPQDPLSPKTPAPNELFVPLNTAASPGEISVEYNGDLLNLFFRDVALRDVLGVIAKGEGMNLIYSSGADTKITGNFRSITFEDAMNTVLSVSGHTWTKRNNVIIVTSMTNELKLAPTAQGRLVQVFTLNYLSASDVLKSCTGLLSPSGSITSTESDPKNGQKTVEQVMVEDLPEYLDRIAEMIAQLDIQPRQVLIEAHILEVALKNEFSQGVDFSKLGSIAGTDILVGTPGFNGAIASLDSFTTPSYNIGIFNAGGFSGLITALQKTNDAKTLASPKVLALNGQEAHVQIGKKLGYHVTTTTQTSTLQSVMFLETGVVLRVTPRITADNQIMMTVKPEVSDGAVDALGLPSTTTTEVDTSIMLPDGKGMVIGGLIKETDITNQQKVPVLGSLWMVGKLFRKNAVTRERSEIIIVLVPHIVGGPHFDVCDEEQKIQRTTTPLLEGPLNRVPRPWEAKLPDAMENPRRLDRRRIPEMLRRPSKGPPNHLEHYFPIDENYESQPLIFTSGPVEHIKNQSGEYITPDPYPWEDLEFEIPAQGGPTSKSSQ